MASAGAAAATACDAPACQCPISSSRSSSPFRAAGDDGSGDGSDAASTSSSSSSGAFETVLGHFGTTEVVFVREGVTVRPCQQRRIPGRLSLVKQQAVLFLSWLPYGSGEPSSGTSNDRSSGGSRHIATATPAAAAAPDGWEDAAADVADVVAADAASDVGAVSPGSGSSSTQPQPSAAAACQQQQHDGDRSMYAIRPCPLSDMFALVAHTPPLGAPHQLTVVLRSGLTLPPLALQPGGVAQLLAAMQQHASLSPAAGAPGTWLVNDTADPLTRSLVALELADLELGAPPPGASCVPPPRYGHGGTRRRAPASKRSSGTAIADAAAAPASTGGRSDGGAGGSSSGSSSPRAWPAPRCAAWSSVSAELLSAAAAAATVAAAAAGAAPLKGLRSTLRSVGAGARSFAVAAVDGWAADVLHHYEHEVTLLEDAAAVAQPGDEALQPAAPAAAADAVGDACAALPDAADTSSCWLQTAVGSFELLEGVPADGLSDALLSSHTLQQQQVPPLGLTELQQQLLDGQGCMQDMAALRQRVFTGGVEPAARREVWKWLLGVHPADSSIISRAALRQQHEAGFAALLAQWEHEQRQQRQQEVASVEQQLLPGEEQQDQQQLLLRERSSRIDRDVKRTDRQHPFYRGRGASARLRSLRNVLRAHCCHNAALGYCQGMSDLASPLLVVAEGDEVDAFWSFAALMTRLGQNFALAGDQHGMHAQLGALRQLLQVLDPPLHAFLEERGCLNYFHCFRWLLIHWKREFAFDQVLELWTAFWSCPSTRQLHIYLAAAVLIQHRRLLLSNPALDLDGLLAFAVQLAGRIDLPSTLALARALVTVAGAAGEHCVEGLP